MGWHVIRFQRDRLAKTFHRRGAHASGGEGIAEVAVEDLALVVGQSAHDELARLRVVATVVRDEAEQVERVGVVRFGREDLAINGFGVGQATGLLMG